MKATSAVRVVSHHPEKTVVKVGDYQTDTATCTQGKKDSGKLIESRMKKETEDETQARKYYQIYKGKKIGMG